MSQILTISDSLYARLQTEAQLRGLSIEQLLEEWEQRDSELKQRREVVTAIDNLRERISQQYNVMPDSVELIREDRER